MKEIHSQLNPLKKVKKAIQMSIKADSEDAEAIEQEDIQIPISQFV
ncbi:hypothetical protein PABG_11307 [Paracoccidioides brasiliensis Pb03]|nr:hypothetical protein PABG_11307 [Paracoccidioides brasiliensis Pb03]